MFPPEVFGQRAPNTDIGTGFHDASPRNLKGPDCCREFWQPTVSVANQLLRLKHRIFPGQPTPVISGMMDTEASENTFMQ